MKTLVCFACAATLSVAAAAARPERGVYFATHFGNWYDRAPDEEIVRYVEELAEWGCADVSAWFDMHDYKGIDDPRAQRRLKRVKTIFGAAQRAGMGRDLLFLANEAFADSPQALRADWKGGANGYSRDLCGHYCVELCPSKPGAVEQLLAWRRQVFDAFADTPLTRVTIWPYDQGGCTCAACAPWGAKAYPDLAKRMAELARATFPKVSVNLSTWYFGDFRVDKDDEWKGLRARADEIRPWADRLYVTTYDLPRLARDPFMPHFAMNEISMAGMDPWGFFGANPMPKALERQVLGHPSALGFRPYSEGIYEDLNKVIVLALLTGRAKTAAEAVEAYATRYFGAATREAVREAAFILERNLGHKAELWQGGRRLGLVEKRPALDPNRPAEVRAACSRLDRAAALRADALLKAAEEKMSAEARRSWRWRLLRIRADFDAATARGEPLDDAALEELAALYHAGPDTIMGLKPISARQLTAAAAAKKQQADSAVLKPLPLGSVTARGWLKDQMLRNKSGMGGHLDELEPQMIGTPWTTRETHKPWGENAPGWGAEISGNYWAGLIGLAFTLDDAELKAKAEKWVNAVLKNAEPGGYLGTYTEKDNRFDDYCAGAGACGYHALLDYAEATGRKDVFEAVHRAMVWFCENWAGDRKTRYAGPEICSTMLEIYCQTGDRRLLDFARDYLRFLEQKDLFLTTPRAFASGDFEYNVNHAVAYVNRMSQPAMYFLATGEPFFREASVRGVEKLHANAYHATGAASGNDEYLSRPSTIGESEYCGFAGAIDSYMRILWATGDTRYGDYAEETFFNAAQGARKNDEKAIQYFSSPNMIFATDHSSHTHMGDNLFGPVPSVSCCAVRSVQVLPGFTRMLAMSDRQGALVLTGYAPCTIRYRGCELACETLYPFKGEIVYTVKAAKPVRFAIRPKKPVWCERMTVRVNGEEGARTNREWKDGDTLSITLAMPPRVARFDDRSAVQPLVVRKGPLVFSLPIREKWENVGDGVKSADNGHAITKLPKGWAWWKVHPVADEKPTPIYEWQGYRRELMTWNVALDEKRVAIEEVANPKAGYVWEEPPVKLRLTAWKAPFAFPPYSNKATEYYAPEQTVTRPVPVTLVPFGCTALRITYFPRCDSTHLRKDLSFELP